jgi:nicotinate-nucleotide adenylyltransferase
MKLGLFGGCFDPIHYGHIRPVQRAKVQLGLDRVIFLPTAVPPHKPGRQLASPHARFAMVELALLEDDDLLVSAVELTPDRPFYTVDSLRHFRAEYPEAELFLLLGCDSLAELHTWKRWQEIAELASFGVLTRPDWRWEELRDRVPPEIAALAAGERVSFIANEPETISATEIRHRLEQGLEVAAEMVPELVLKYMRKYSLYR